MIGADQEARHAIGLAMQVINAIVPPEPDTALLDNDPVSYLRAQAASQTGALGVVAQIAGRSEAGGRARRANQSRAIKKALADEARVMVEKSPPLQQSRAGRNSAMRRSRLARGLTA